MIDALVQTLIASENEAADDLLLQALRLGTEAEQALALSALLKRQKTRGLSGVVAQYQTLPDALKLTVLENIKLFHSALRECGRSVDHARRLAALKLVALGRQGKLTYVLSENIHDSDDALSQVAVEAMVALARWAATETRKLQQWSPKPAAPAPTPLPNPAPVPAAGKSAVPAAAAAESCANPADLPIYREIIEQRPEIEQAVARALDVHRGRHGPELLRAALLLCDWPGSKTLAILQTAKHGGQTPMVRRLQQPPASEHVEAFLLAASHGQLRSHFGVAFSHIDEGPVLDALLRRTHWLKDHQLQLCMHQVSRGTWWDDAALLHDLAHRDPADAARIGEWIFASGMHDVVQDERLEKIRQHVAAHFEARLRLLRLALRRPRRGSSVELLRQFLADSDERLIRLAAREIVRRRPKDFENMLLPLMAAAPPSVRRVISRSIGQSGFDSFWQRFDRLDRATRKNAGRAMLKVLPDAIQRLSHRLTGGPLDQRLKALQIVQELDAADALRPVILQICADPNAKLRSKAVSVLGEMPSISPDLLLDRDLQDSDARVRANAIEALESRQKTEYLPLLAQRARAANNRERANAIKALHRMKVRAAGQSLQLMLRDERPEHRISALWTLRQIGWWQLLNEVGRLAKEDANLRVRRYALGVLRAVAQTLQLVQPDSQQPPQSKAG